MGLRITKADLRRWDYTPGCVRCNLAKNGGQVRRGAGHSNRCRIKIEKKMESVNNPRIVEARKRAQKQMRLDHFDEDVNVARRNLIEQAKSSKEQANSSKEQANSSKGQANSSMEPQEEHFRIGQTQWKEQVRSRGIDPAASSSMALEGATPIWTRDPRAM